MKLRVYVYNVYNWEGLSIMYINGEGLSITVFSREGLSIMYLIERDCL